MSYIFPSLKDTSFIHHFVKYLGSYQISEHWWDNISVFSKELSLNCAALLTTCIHSFNILFGYNSTTHGYPDTAEHPVVNKFKIQNSRPISKYYLSLGSRICQLFCLCCVSWLRWLRPLSKLKLQKTQTNKQAARKEQRYVCCDASHN